MIFYDNIPLASVEAEVASIDRVYTLALSDFSPSDWTKLQSIYASLPGWIGSDDDGCACWHGPTHSQPFLIASVEPSGLHITGRLYKHDWERWHEAFMASIRELPTFDV